MNNQQLEKLIDKLLDGKKSKRSLVDQLYKIPSRDKDGGNTVCTHTNSGYFQCIDSLYLPNDRGFIYALVLCYQVRKFDMEPMKDRKVSDIVKALKEIYKRKILKKQKVI